MSNIEVFHINLLTMRELSFLSNSKSQCRRVACNEKPVMKIKSKYVISAYKQYCISAKEVGGMNLKLETCLYA